ncbi:MAG TPA: hypothetical protein VHD76_21750 [Bryobacteraceae bacterium]|jgi:hypothetical protein|nr:hypothetical protein [Bryobacteraceae bacterium]
MATISKRNLTAPTKGDRGTTRPIPTKGDPDRPIPNPDPPHRGGAGQGDGKDPHYTPWLVIRAQAGDDGTRPLAPGTTFWESPDIWTQGSHGTNQPVAGEATQVFARITNLGMQDATGVTVKYWWANPSIAITEVSAHLIAQDSVAIPAGNSLVFQSPADWVPVVENGGHECLLVEAFIPVFDPLVNPMAPWNDRHVGQKNEDLVILQQGQMFRIQLEAHNFTRTVQRVTIETRRARVPGNFAQKFGGRFAEMRLLEPPRGLPVQIDFAEKAIRTVQSRLLNPKAAAEAGGCLPPPDTAKTQVFKPGELRAVTITGVIPPTAVPGEIYATRVTQRFGNAVTGGYTIYATVL